ncbi:hypothetical protein P3X46_002419 [Hevea brasiliensis]|uniref:Disease resistance protein RGA3 n=1 Tax=Hevea brasiliensis TaxID=3981 RepID=A0ABQ9N3Y5_HEVBR|nr:putative disease resistance protein RGA1 [Hevea brasiliensis]XP_057990651.1 putative disease resistance protein RGA1 [Hevea brasiliensis]XP_057990657.1 putative disease resistance protein RGA1 [Hevea brasiliensis]XP_057990663.1 putative disease resistance protein RGA1 [Hevea brasiliensis]KAJ9186899.1 hypothetical protein P3X46_002419 [Hevea brasiliensis]
MADIVLSPLLQVVFDKLSTPLLDEIANRFGLRREVTKLCHKLRAIRAVLEDAEEQQLTGRAFRNWLEELKRVAYDVEDFLDEFSPEAIHCVSRNGFIEQVRNLHPSLGQFVNQLDMFPRITQIGETLELLVEERSNFHLREQVARPSNRRRRTGSSVVESEIHGRLEDKEKIVKLLLSAENMSPGDISVVSIVGLGGLGKTTLAQLVYNDERIARHFNLKMWACINDDFDVERIMMSILESASNVRGDFTEMDALQFRLQELLIGKRYLLVLDDVWNEDDNEWDKLRTSLKGGVEGSTVIVTTRSEKVALIMGTSYIHYLQGLSDKDCWALFEKRAFGRDADKHRRLFPIGKQIVKKCEGVPLAARTIGGLMRFKGDEREWLLVQDSDLWDLSQNENGILAALKLSYNHLPSHLKACFAYCSIFPRNYIIKKEKLIQLWIAAGLIQSLEGRKTLEFIGNEYFDDLVWMCFFQDIHRSDNGTILECKMHGLIHDLAQSIAGNEYLRVENDRMLQNFSQIRHSSVICNFSLHTIPESLYEAKKLRTLILLLPKGDLGEVPPNVFSNFRYLRVLDLSSSGIKKLSASISSFIFLRYLDISNTHVKNLPESVCSLQNLQVMNLSGCYDLNELPSGMTRLSKLRHLILNGCDRLSKIPALIGKLVYLRTLSMFIVGREIGESISELENLNLGGKLTIRCLENVMEAAEAIEADLIGKRNLQSLALSWENDHGIMSSANDGRVEQVLNYLQPHKYLKKLSIKEYQGMHFPGWMAFCKLPNLTKLVLINCRRCKDLPTLGQIPFLKVLYLQGMHAVKSIGSQFYGQTEKAFPSLEELTLMDFPILETWWSFNRREDFPSLAKLIINKCYKLRNMPYVPFLQHLELRSCDNMVLESASNLTSLTILVIDEFAELVFLESLLQSNTLLMSLVISSCPKLCSISPSLAELKSLKSLAVRWCKELHSLPHGLQNLTSLESLEIVECHSLVSLPEDIQGLRSLRSLSIENCNNLTSLPLELQFPASLEHLTVMYCPQLAALPDDFQHPCALGSLSILNLPKLSSLPQGLQYVTTLQNLEIRGCPSLKALPEWLVNLTLLRSLALSECQNLKSLPEGFQHLSSLQHLSIQECSILEERCRRDVGEDWPKIAHIAHFHMGSQEHRDYSATSSSTH